MIKQIKILNLIPIILHLLIPYIMKVFLKQLRIIKYVAMLYLTSHLKLMDNTIIMIKKDMLKLLLEIVCNML